MERRNSGRQKVKMEKMKKESNLQVTFSKRRSGLFKKASELCILCGVEVALIVFSPGKKVYSFGHPSVEAISARYMGQSSARLSTSAMELVAGSRNAHIRALNVQLTQMQAELEEERERGKELDRIIQANREQIWWQKPIDELNQEQLLQVQASIEQLKKDVARQTEEILMESPTVPQATYFQGNSSNPFAGPSVQLPPTQTAFFPGTMPPPPPLPLPPGFGFNYGSHSGAFP